MTTLARCRFLAHALRPPFSGPRTALHHCLFVSLVFLGACSTTARYYRTQTVDHRLSCFRPLSFALPKTDNRWPDYYRALHEVNQTFATSNRAIASDFFDQMSCTRTQRHLEHRMGCESAPNPCLKLAESPVPDVAYSPTPTPSAGDSPRETPTHITHCRAPSPPLPGHIAVFTEPLVAAPAPQSSPGATAPAPGTDPFANLSSQLSQQVTLIISSYLYPPAPADRLYQVQTLIVPIDKDVTFQSVPGTRTTALLSAGTLTSTNELDLSLGSPATAPVSTSATPKFTQSFAEAIAKQYTTQNVEIFPNRNMLFISQNAGPGAADISGNTITSVTLKLSPSLCQDVRIWARVTPAPGGPTPVPCVCCNCKTGPGAKATPTPPFSSQAICYIGEVDGLAASVAVARTVDRHCATDTFGDLLGHLGYALHLSGRPECGADTIAEDDDVAVLQPFKSYRVFELWRNPISLYGITFDGVGRDNSVVVRDGHYQSELLFGGADDAVAFRGWLVAQLTDVSKVRALSQGRLVWFDKVELGLSGGAVPDSIAAPSVKVFAYPRPTPSPNGTPLTCSPTARPF